MEQFYLITIVANVVVGLALASDYLGKKMTFFKGFSVIRENRTTEIVIGLLTVIIGVLKLIVKSPGEAIPVVGDFLPALSGIFLGLMLLAEAFPTQISTEKEGQVTVKKAERKILAYSAPIGIAGVVIALVHFIIPGVPVL